MHLLRAILVGSNITPKIWYWLKWSCEYHAESKECFGQNVKITQWQTIY
jgi:hypothetical protein